MRKTVFFLIIIYLFPLYSLYATVCIDENFNTSNSLMYGFSGRYGSPKLTGCSYPVSWSGEEYCLAHDSTGDSDSSGAAHIIIHQTASQFQFGWYDGNCSGWTDGDILRFKVRVKYDSQYYHTEDHKVLVWGTGGNRIIINGRTPNNFGGNCVGNSSSSSGYCTNTDAGTSCTDDSDCLISNVQGWCQPQNSYGSGDGSWAINTGIAAPCSGPAGDGGAATQSFPLDEWVWVQGAVKVGSNGYMKIWVNNTNESEPNACTGSASDCPASTTYGYPEGDGPLNISVSAWDGQVDLGVYWQNTESQDMGMYYGAFQVSRNESFDATWDADGGTDTNLPFTDSFEDGTTDAWSNTQNATVTTNGSPPDGSHCLSGALTYGTYSDNYVDRTFGDHVDYGGTKVEEYWLEYKVKITSGYTLPDDATKFQIVNLTDGSSWTRRFQLMSRLYNDSGTGKIEMQLADQTDSAQYLRVPQNQGSDVAFTYDTWHTVRIWCRLNDNTSSEQSISSGDGAIKMWVDGNLRADYDSVTIRESDYPTIGVNLLIIGSYTTPTTSGNGTIYWDDVKLYGSDPEWGADPATPNIVGVTIH
jgi:hypothetical protein